jgi:hypothetical protein
MPQDTAHACESFDPSDYGHLEFSLYDQIAPDFGFSVVPPTLRIRHIPQRVRMSTDGASHGFS